MIALVHDLPFSNSPVLVIPYLSNNIISCLESFTEFDAPKPETVATIVVIGTCDRADAMRSPAHRCKDRVLLLKVFLPHQTLPVITY